MGDIRENWTHEKVITHRFGFLLIVTVLFTVTVCFTCTGNKTHNVILRPKFEK